MYRNEVITTEGVVQTGTVAKTILRATTPANGADAVEFSASFRGATQEILVEVVQGATGGTDGGSCTPRELGMSGSMSPAAKMAGKKAFSAEPSGGEVVFQELVEAGYTWRLRFRCKPGTNYDIRVTSPADVPCSARMIFGVDIHP